MQKQLAYILARQQVTLPSELLTNLDEEQNELFQILNNTALSHHYQKFATTLSLFEPKSLEDIYKSHLDDNPSSTANRGQGSVDSARQNLAGTFVNAFVNAACGNEKLLVGAEEGQSWIYKTKEAGLSLIFKIRVFSMLMMDWNRHAFCRGFLRSFTPVGSRKWSIANRQILLRN